MEKKKQFWWGVLQSVLGAFFFAIIVAAFIFITSYNKSDDGVKAGSKIEQFVEPQETKPNDTIH